jgi:hypothetical protein
MKIILQRYKFTITSIKKHTDTANPVLFVWTDLYLCRKYLRLCSKVFCS